jgi:beta-phosphoglucomutase-like phosphatase (HAD superfamily)
MYNQSNMLPFSKCLGAIFDVDDTLLSNFPNGSTVGLHEISRLAAAHEVGVRCGSVNLQNFTIEQCTQAFRDAKVHTLQAAAWQMLLMAGEVMTDNIEPDHPLLNQIIELKDKLHERILREQGSEVPGAVAFVRALAQGGLADRLGIASTACRRDIDVFLEMTNLGDIFTDERIFSRERFTHPKPHPEPFNLAFASLGLPEEARSQIWAFEDDPRGIMSAKAAGLYTCAITTRFSREDLAGLAVPPDLIADSYAEFANVLQVPTSKATPIAA